MIVGSSKLSAGGTLAGGSELDFRWVLLKRIFFALILKIPLPSGHHLPGRALGGGCGCPAAGLYSKTAQPRIYFPTSRPHFLPRAGASRGARGLHRTPGGLCCSPGPLRSPFPTPGTSLLTACPAHSPEAAATGRPSEQVSQVALVPGNPSFETQL